MPRFRSATIALGFEIGPAAGLLVDPQGTFMTNSLPLRGLIAFAYDVQDPAIHGPALLDSERYSIRAEPEDVPALPVEIDRFRLMVRELLAERFGLAVHWETRSSRALALRRVADAPGLKKAAASDPGPVIRLRGATSISVGNAALEPLFTSWLATRCGAPVVDRTGLEGTYTFELAWEPDAAGDEPDEPSREALGHALRMQLGLTLEAVEAEVERLVVDRVDRPAELEPAPVPLDVDHATFDRYVGRYALPGDSVMEVSRDGARLLTRLKGQQPIELFPVSETEFFPKAFPARVEFVVSDDGRAASLVLRQGGREIHGRRIDDADT